MNTATHSEEGAAGVWCCLFKLCKKTLQQEETFVITTKIKPVSLYSSLLAQLDWKHSQLSEMQLFAVHEVVSNVKYGYQPV